ncbi:hypothetical protein T265_05417 [Opisthorchis viverrini]|uniref:Uncharacterized protein n=1 Tax=Opisthorchis viverrini TaxID=6198 RepID=A0A075AFD2_OPIVI|nr:hypothetical protein T265_05417 [Opisthorchis viverrini]KER27604.1 hypothetical protein T265_05417 [Opisthorchis viverrini]
MYGTWGEIAQLSGRKSTDLEERGSNLISDPRLTLSRLGQPGSSPVLVLPSGDVAARLERRQQTQALHVTRGDVHHYHKHQTFAPEAKSIHDCVFHRIARVIFHIFCKTYFKPLLRYTNQTVYSERRKNVTFVVHAQRASRKMVRCLKSVCYKKRLTVLDLLEYCRL